MFCYQLRERRSTYKLTNLGPAFEYALVLLQELITPVECKLISKEL